MKATEFSRLLVAPAVPLILLALGCSLACNLQKPSGAQEQPKDWWQTAQFYQIYPRSFMDSNDDGIGDIKGITSRLEYLKDIGVTATWLSPIFKSPMVDFGYDIADYYEIQDEYGTMDDFRELVAKANSLGLKIILDFVPNHTSNESEWFQKSLRRERGYEDYYVWHDGKLDANGNRIPPSNWLQGSGGSAWEWREERQQYYYHQYTVQQPDLNFRNPAVVEQMKRVMRFWLDQGVAGFRVDAVPMLFEVAPDENGQYPDEEVSGLTDDKDDPAYLIANMVQEQPETIDMIYQWRKVTDDYQRIYGGDTRVLLIETGSPPAYTMQMYGNRSVEGAQMPFNFNLIFMLKPNVTAPLVQQAADRWLKNMPAGRTANWVIGNHDNRRAASRFGRHRTDAMNMLVMTLPGASVTYQGEELGMIDGVISWEDSVDSLACNANKDTFERFTRDPCRTPFQWSAGTNAGFSKASKTWLPLAPDYETLNVEAEQSNARSHLSIYKSLTELRKSSKTMQNGGYKYKALDDGVFVLKRYLAGAETIVFVANFGDAEETVDVQADFDVYLPNAMTLKILSADSPKAIGTEINLKKLTLAAGEALVLSAPSKGNVLKNAHFA